MTDQCPQYKFINIVFYYFQLMSIDEKNHYQILADELNENRNKNDDAKHHDESISDLLDGSFDYWTMKNDIKKKFGSINTNGKKYLFNFCLPITEVNLFNSWNEQFFAYCVNWLSELLNSQIKSSQFYEFRL